MFRRIIRFIGTTFGFALMLAIVVALTVCLDVAVKGILNNDVCILEIAEIRTNVQNLGVFSFLSAIVNGFFDFLYNAEARNAVVFIILLWSLSSMGLKGSQISKGNHMSFYTWEMAKKICFKMTSFPKVWWFKVICAVTLFVPILLAYTAACALLIVGWLANVILAPIAYVVLSYYVAVTAG